MSRYARKVDGNQGEIVAALEAIGVRVFDTSSVGQGLPDLVCMRGGKTTWVEVKNGDRPPSARKLTLAQVRFRDKALSAGVQIHVVENIEQALAVFGARRAA
jgi:hypothetical protein